MVKQLAGQVSAASFSLQGRPKYRVFVIQEADALSVGAQAGLRRTLERYVTTSRLFLHCQQLSSIIAPLKSRCLCIRVPLPTDAEIKTVLTNIQKNEHLNVPNNIMDAIIGNSKRNLRRAILMLESSTVHKCV
eukprot:GHVO01053481.1.p1 GENE.GHVO01053481.1~~GHVO01053481.1.p1  ORF type:complete len:133 (+),score=10.26 GHVO01053481.1:86-484(+)